MILFFSNTVAQLMNAIVIKDNYYENDDCDLIYGRFNKDKINIVRHLSIFHTFYEYPYFEKIAGERIGISKQIQRIRSTFNLENLKKQMGIDFTQYTDIFLSSTSIRILEIYYIAKKENPDIKLHLYEEGTQEYCILEQKRKYHHIIYSKIFFGRYFLQECVSLYVYRPEYIINKWSNICLKKIGVIKDTTLKKLNAIFNVDVNKRFFSGYKYIFLDQTFPDPREENDQKKIISSILDTVDSKEIIIKLHPRSQKDKYEDVCNTLTCKIPLELLALNEDIDDKVFFTMYSSAALNLHFCANKRCKIVFLNELLTSDEASMKKDAIVKSVDGLIARFKRQETDCVFIPHSYNELIAMLKVL